MTNGLPLTPRWTDGVSRTILDNGLTVLTQFDPDVPAVAVVTHVKAGFFDEPDHWQGISHVLEHMFFKGTPTRGVGQIAAETKALGGYLNAATAYDWTSYYVVLPVEGFAQALDIQADALLRATLDGDELGRELKVIIEEARRKLDSPSALAHETLHAILFDHHRIRRWRIGTEKQLAGFTREDVHGYYRSRYVPSRTIVSVVGAVPEPEALAAVRTAFAGWEARAPSLDPSPEEPPRRAVRVQTLRGDVRQADLVFGWRGVPYRHPDGPALDMAAMVLSSGRGSWLYRALRQPGFVTSTAAHNYTPSEVGVFSIAADLAPDQVGRVTALVAGLVAGLSTVGPAPADLERAATLLTAQLARRIESVDGRASAFAMAEASGGVGELDAEYQRILAVTVDDVRRAAAKYLCPDAVSAVLYLPQSTGDDLEATALAATFTSAVPQVVAAPVVAPVEVPPPRPVRPVRRRDIVTVELPGVDLLIRRKASVPTVTLGVHQRVVVRESAALAGVAALAVRSLTRGTSRFDAAELAAQFEACGGTLGTSIAADWFGVSATALADRWPRAAMLLQEVLWDPAFAPDEVSRERSALIGEGIQAGDDMFRRPIDLALAAAFGDADYGLPVKGTPESLAALGVADVTGWHQRAVGADRPVVVAVGNLDPVLAAETLAGIFADRPALARAVRPAASRWTRKLPLLVEQRAKSQSALAMLFPGPDRNHPSRHAAEVLAAIASGLGGRLFHALRDERSLAYTVLLSSWQRPRAGGLITYIATSPEREDEARDAMLQELARFADEPVAETEMTRAVNYLAGQIVVQRQAAAALASEMVGAWLNGSGLAELDDPAGPYRAVTPEAVRALAEASLVADARAEGVVRGGRALD